MKTKLVYVLTCSPEDTYIEQALISVWSARYHNPDTPIILLVDDKTDKLLVGKRGEILDYISEKIVVPFDADKSMHYRSRWLKTKSRELVQGDMFYIDCDTIVTTDLSAIEQVDAEIAMVRDENVDFQDEVDSIAQKMIDYCNIIGVDLAKEKYYFNGGIIYAKDTELTHRIFTKWHAYWQEGLQVGLNIDQPSFAKSNLECERPVVLLEDRWNAIASTQIEEIYSAYILHFWRGVSFFYNQSAMQYIQDNGLTDIVKYYILHPTYTFLPFDSHVAQYKGNDYIRFYKILKRALKDYGTHFDSDFEGLKIHSKTQNLAMWLLHHRMFGMASLLIVATKWYRVKCSSNFRIIDNIYKKQQLQ